MARKDRKLGVAQDKRIYDLPLNKSEGTGFLILLIGLMSFLACIALAASFALDEMGQRWSSGLENRVTIEIPAEDETGKVGSPGYVKDLTISVADALSRNPLIKSAEPLKEDEIKDLISPWLGEDVITQDLPLPGIISVELYDATPEAVQSLERTLTPMAPKAKLDTHASWLADLLRFTSALKFAALSIVIIISVTTITAVAGAIRSRMAINRAEVELLHIMGAKDEYITTQFQRHALILAVQGSAAGMIAAIVIMFIIALMAGDTAQGLIPNFSLGILHIFLILAVPGFAALIATFTARVTVLRDLARMP